MPELFKKFWSAEEGATAIEYTLIACLLAASLIALWPTFYGDFLQTWTNVGSTIGSAVKLPR